MDVQTGGDFKIFVRISFILVLKASQNVYLINHILWNLACLV